MGLFDLFTKKRESTKTSISRNIKRSDTERIESQRSTHVINQNVRKPFYVKVSDKTTIERNLCLSSQPEEKQLELICPIRKAKIYCHSVLIDKLGDLTKFIVSSIYKGHSIEEICLLTRMGNATVEEELEYLIRGGLLTENKKELTELGAQYGKLLEIFERLSAGIDQSFNTFLNIFEPLDEGDLIDEPNEQCLLGSRFIPALARNDNFANSLLIAKEQILSDTPFCSEIKNSLYTTVKIEKEKKYKKVYLRNFDRGLISDNGSCIKIAIPFDRVSFKPRYKIIDDYRDVIPSIKAGFEQYPELFSEKAKEIIDKAVEEDAVGASVKDINTITGAITRMKNDLIDNLEDDSAFVLEGQHIQLTINSAECSGVYLEEMSRERLYQIRYFPYSRMEI